MTRTFLAISTSTEEVTTDPKAKAMAAAAQVAKSLDEGEPTATPGINSRMIRFSLMALSMLPQIQVPCLRPITQIQVVIHWLHWEPGTNHGSLYYPAEVLKPLTLAAADLNMDLHIHATGERSVREMLNVRGFKAEY